MMTIKKTTILLLSAAFSLNSCIKDELPNQECDIKSAYVHVDNPSELFYQLSDTIAPIDQSLSSANIVFRNIKPWYDVQMMAPVFTISEGATLIPASGTLRDFSDNAQQIYFCVAEDEKELLREIQTLDNATEKLFEAYRSEKHHIRIYNVQFQHSEESGDVAEYSFDDGYIYDDYSTKVLHYLYYVWSDPNDETKSGWATANPGFSLTAGSATPDQYPTSLLEYAGVDGKHAVKLETCSTGSMGKLFKMPIAAGNFFLGTFDIKKAFTSTLSATHFGENCAITRKPERFTGYYKYTPGEQITDANLNNIDGTDEPALYCVVYRNHDDEGNSVVLDGTTIETSPFIIGRAEIKEWKMNTDDWVPFSLDFTWTQPIDEELLAQRGYNITIVCSSSKNGGTFTGAIGSKLLVDNFKLYYESNNTSNSK